MLSRSEFDVMLALKKTPTASQRAIASECGMSLGTVNAVVKSLGDRGLVEGGTLTAEGEDELSPYKVRNAVIMAAGLSSRMAPLSYECPKGVLKVRGEVLIERQIRQLKEAGIDDITVVVGFKKEEFFYLEDLFGVKIVVNTDYATRNNHATLFQVRDIIGNTYICSSDNYFASNPFERYVYDSYYAAVFEEGETDEYCLQTKGRDKRITGAVVGGSHSWVIMGHAYWTRDFTCDFMRFLSQEYHLTETVGKLWDDIFLEHADELRMYMRPYKKGEIREFDSLYQLQDFDPLFIENVASNVLDNICATLNCQRGDISNVKPIKKGLTNLSFYFECRGEAFVYRHPGAGTDEIVNRQAETYALKIASDLGLDSSFVYEDPNLGWKISHYIPDCVPFDYGNDEHVGRALSLVRRLHESGADSPGRSTFTMRRARSSCCLRPRTGRSLQTSSRSRGKSSGLFRSFAQDRERQFFAITTSTARTSSCMATGCASSIGNMLRWATTAAISAISLRRGRATALNARSKLSLCTSGARPPQTRCFT